MGRKSRHKRIKAVDPFCTGERKKALLKKDLKFENKPDTLEQQIPPSLLVLQKAIEDTKNRQGGNKRRNTSETTDTEVKRKKHPKHVEYDAEVLNVKRRPRESTHNYVRRVNDAAFNFIEKTKMEIKQSKDGPKRRMNAKEKEKMKFRKKKQQLKKTNKRLDAMEEEILHDKVKFGDVNRRPPEFTAAPKKSQAMNNKAGQRKLLLSHLFSSSAAKTANSAAHSKATHQPRKRKHMSFAEKRIFDKDREAAIDAYRLVKAKRMKLKQPRTGVS